MGILWFVVYRTGISNIQYIIVAGCIMSLYPVCAGHRIGFIRTQQQQYYVGEPVAPRFNKGRQNGLGVKKCNEMRDTCRIRSARVIRAKFLAMHFPRTWPTDVDVALSPYSAAVRHWYIITITTTVITAMASLSLSLSFSVTVQFIYQLWWMRRRRRSKSFR